MNNPRTRDFDERLLKIKGLTAIVEEALVNQAKSLANDLAKDVDACTESQKEDLYESYGEDYFELSTELPTLFRYSMLTASASAFDQYLTETAVGYAEVKDVAIKITDLRGNGILRAQQYFQKVVRLDFPENTSAWKNILKVRDLRNCVVHADGYIPEQKKELLDWIEKTPGIKLANGCIITLEPDFIHTVFEWYNSFAVDFDKACQSLGLWGTVFPDLESNK